MRTLKTTTIFNAIIVGVLSIIFIIYALYLGENILDPGDGLKHFQIAKYSWEIPHLLFNHWGKPLFTILSSPYAQFGFSGMIFFNITLFIITAIFLIKIAKYLEFKNGLLAVVFLFCSPIYFHNVLSGLTEVLFSALLTVSIYLLLKKNFLWSCIIFSFSFFSRPESSLILPFFLFYLVIEKQYKYIPLFFIGIVLFSVLGFPFYDDIFWVFTKRPYSSLGTYGSGELLHFLKEYKNVFGTIISFFFLVGLIPLFKLGCRKNTRKKAILSSLLLLAPIIAVVGGHSIMWWKGLQGSAGLTRVLTTIVPCVAIIALMGLNEIILRLKEHFKIPEKFIVFFLIALGSVFVFKKSFNLWVDERMITSEEVLGDAAHWYKKNGKQNKVYYMPPYFAYRANINPFSEKGNMEHMKRFKDKQTPSNNMKKGEFLLWEGQFSALEGRLPLQNCTNDTNLILIKSFYSQKEIKFYNKKYVVYLFMKKN